jgi:hypothetical protein
VQRFRLFGQLPGRNKLKGPGSRLLVSAFPEIKFIEREVVDAPGCR